MSTQRRPAIAWDATLRAWRIRGGPAGPAGWASIHLDELTWRVDWIDPEQLVEGFIVVDGDVPSAPIPQGAADWVARLCGDDVARLLLTLPGSAGGAVEVDFDPDLALARRAVGRAAIASEHVAASRCPSWWSVEAADFAIAHRTADAVAATDDAFEVVDAVSSELLASFRDHGLGEPLRQVLRAVGYAESELPAELRLGDDEVERRLREMIAAIDELSTDVESRPPPLERVRGVPSFRGAGGVPEVLGAEDAPRTYEVDIVDDPGGRIVAASCVALGPDSLEVEVRSFGSVDDLFARVVSSSVAATSVRLEPDGADGMVSILRGTLAASDVGADSSDWLVELTVDPGGDVLPASLRPDQLARNAARSATTLERAARALVALPLDSWRELATSAAGLWADAAERWADVERDTVAVRASVASRHAAGLWDLLGKARERETAFAHALDHDPGFDPSAWDGAVGVGWAEPAAALVADFVRRDLAGGVGERSDADVTHLLVLADSVDDVASVSRLRDELRRRAPVDSTKAEVLGRFAMGEGTVEGGS